MAGAGNIDTSGLSPQLRQVLGLDIGDNQQPLAMPQPEPFNPVLPANIRSLLGAPQPVHEDSPVQNGPDYAVPAPNVPSDIKAVQKANIAYTKQQAKDAKALAAAGQRMPTVADAQHEQQAASGQELRANDAATGVQAAAAQEQHLVNQQAADDLRVNADDLRAKQAESDKVRGQKEAAVAAAMAEVDNYKVDPHRYWNNASTGQKVSWFVAMALTGLGELLQNGKVTKGVSPIVEQLHAVIDKDVRDQVDRREQLKEKLGRARDSVDQWDRFSSNQEARILGQRAQKKELAAQMLLTAASKFGSDAAIANGMKGAAEIRKSAAKDAMAAVDLAHGHAMQEGQLANAKQNTAIAGGHLALAKKQFEWTKDYQQQSLDVEAAKLAQAGNKKGSEDLRKFGVGAPPKTVVGEDGKPQIVAGPLRSKDGTPFLARNEEQALKMGRKVYVAGQINDIINKVLDIRDRVGGESAAFNSDERQKLDVLQAQLIKLSKDGTEGMSSDEDMKKLAASLGAADIASFRARAAGLEEGRDRTTQALNAELRSGYNYDGEDITFGNPYAQAAADRPGDADQRAALKTSARTDPGRIAEELPVPDFDPNDPRSKEIRQAAAYTQAGGVVPSQRKAVDVAAADALSDDPDTRTRGIQALRELAYSADSEGLRKIATDRLIRTMMAPRKAK